MIRLIVLASMLAVGIASLGLQATAQSPNPAHLARPRTPRCDPLIVITTFRGPAGHPQT
jgi:hypothetical protein